MTPYFKIYDLCKIGPCDVIYSMLSFCKAYIPEKKRDHMLLILRSPYIVAALGWQTHNAHSIRAEPECAAQPRGSRNPEATSRRDPGAENHCEFRY